MGFSFLRNRRIKMKQEVIELLKTEDPSAKRIAEYLEKMIDGGNTVLEENILESKKSIQDCLDYVYQKAHDLAKTARSIMIDDAIVYGWATHFYDEKGKPSDLKKETPIVTKMNHSSQKNDNKPSYSTNFKKKEVKKDEQLSLF